MRIIQIIGAWLFQPLCYGIAGGSGLVVEHFWGLPGLVIWGVIAVFIGWKIAPNGWDDVY